MRASGGGRRRAARNGGRSVQAREQRQLRERRGERAFIFDKDLSRCIGEVERQDWELVVSMCGGDVPRAAAECGVDGAGPGVKALWGRSCEEALSTYRHWQKGRKL